MSTTCSPSCLYDIKGDKYFCKIHGKMHRCGPNCDARFIGDESQIHCKITGRVLCPVMALHPHHAVERGVDINNDVAPAVSYARSKTIVHNAPTSSVLQCRNIICTLLYGSSRTMLSTKRNKAIHRNIVHEIAKKKKKLKQDRLKKSLIEHIINKVHHAGNKIKILPHNEHFLCDITKRVMRVWNELCKSPYFKENKQTIRFKHVVLGCLYIMSTGYPPVIETIPSLKLKLPRATDIIHLGMNVKSITTGKNHVYRACKSMKRVC